MESSARDDVVIIDSIPSPNESLNGVYIQSKDGTCYQHIDDSSYILWYHKSAKKWFITSKIMEIDSVYAYCLDFDMYSDWYLPNPSENRMTVVDGVVVYKTSKAIIRNSWPERIVIKNRVGTNNCVNGGYILSNKLCKSSDEKFEWPYYYFEEEKMYLQKYRNKWIVSNKCYENSYSANASVSFVACSHDSSLLYTPVYSSNVFRRMVLRFKNQILNEGLSNKATEDSGSKPASTLYTPSAKELAAYPTICDYITSLFRTLLHIQTPNIPKYLSLPAVLYPTMSTVSHLWYVWTDNGVLSPDCNIGVRAHTTGNAPLQRFNIVAQDRPPQYTDASFPHSVATQKIQQRSAFCRTEDFFEGRPDGGVLFDQIEFNDLTQGNLGNCWLVASFAAMAEFPTSIRRVFVQNELSASGKYEFHLYNPGKREFQMITVDNQIPCEPRTWYNDTSTSLFAQPNGREVWVALLEKVFAKLANGYFFLNGGFELNAWNVLTGSENQMAIVRDKAISNRWTVAKMDISKRTPGAGGAVDFGKLSLLPFLDGKDAFLSSPASVWNTLCYFDASNFPMSCSIQSASGECSREDGLVAGHAYTFIGVLEVRDFGRKAEDAKKKSRAFEKSSEDKKGDKNWKTSTTASWKTDTQNFVKPSSFNDDILRLVKIRNPWGMGEWKGEFSDGWNGWQYLQEIIPLIGFAAADDGCFFMEFDTYLQIFDVLYFCASSQLNEVPVFDERVQPKNIQRTVLINGIERLMLAEREAFLQLAKKSTFEKFKDFIPCPPIILSSPLPLNSGPVETVGMRNSTEREEPIERRRSSKVEFNDRSSKGYDDAYYKSRESRETQDTRDPRDSDEGQKWNEERKKKTEWGDIGISSRPGGSVNRDSNRLITMKATRSVNEDFGERNNPETPNFRFSGAQNPSPSSLSVRSTRANRNDDDDPVVVSRQHEDVEKNDERGFGIPLRKNYDEDSSPSMGQSSNVADYLSYNGSVRGDVYGQRRASLQRDDMAGVSRGVVAKGEKLTDKEMLTVHEAFDHMINAYQELEGKYSQLLEGVEKTKFRNFERHLEASNERAQEAIKVISKVPKAEKLTMKDFLEASHSIANRLHNQSHKQYLLENILYLQKNVPLRK